MVGHWVTKGGSAGIERECGEACRQCAAGVGKGRLCSVTDDSIVVGWVDKGDTMDLR